MSAESFARKSLLGCAIVAVVETLLVLKLVEPVMLLFVLGPVMFLGVIAWRRRAHLARSRRLGSLTIGIGTFGIAALGVAFLTHPQNAPPEQAPLAPLAVPLVQWAAVLWVWVSIGRAEAREKLAPTQPPS